MPAGGFRYILAKDSAEGRCDSLPQEFLHLLSVQMENFASPSMILTSSSGTLTGLPKKCGEIGRDSSRGPPFSVSLRSSGRECTRIPFR